MKRLFGLFALVIFAACSGDNSTAPPNPDDGGDNPNGTVTHEDTLRVEMLDDLATHLDQWDGLGADSIAVHATNYLSHEALVKKTGIIEGTTTVWAVFKDGVKLIIPNNREESSAADTLLDDSSIATPKSTMPPRHVVIPAGRRMTQGLRVPSSGREIPERATFRAINAIGTCHVNPLPVLKMLLRKGHYTDAGALPGSVEDMQKIHGNGVFYIDTHGGIGKDESGITFLYGLWTTTPHELPTLATYKKMLANDDLVVLMERSNDPQGNCGFQCHYGITAGFVADNMSFGKNSVVIIDACQSSHAAAYDMQQAFANVGASVYVGWSEIVDDKFAYKATKYLIDRLLGVNEISPENPKQRAFNIYQVRNDMANNRNLVEDPSTHAILTVTKLNGDFGLLSPTIQFLSVDDNGVQPRLIIAGLFGTDPGEANRSVTINDTPLDNISWSPDEIDCDIPESGANASGTVVVKVGTGANTRESNPVNITEWIGELTYERDDPGDQTGQMKIKVRFLADIHSFRDEPGEPPFETTVLFAPRRETSIDATTSGKYVRSEYCTDTFTLGGDGHAKTPFDAGTDGSWTYFGSIDTKSHTLRLVMQMIVVFNAGTWVRTASEDPPCDAFSLPIYVTMAIEDCLFDDTVETTAFLMQMEDNFTVPAAERGPCDADPLATELIGDAPAQAKIKWNEMTPFFLPDPDAAR